ncbi:MAG: diadenylate cyclase CdaA [Clostridia bacterium]|nr:diadenylate cyclase CdaA [Clostridia bacterium]
MSILTEYFRYIISQFRLIDILDIILLTTLVFVIIWFFRDRRAGKLFTGLAIFFAALLLCALLDLRGMNFIFSAILQVGLIALIIIFQPEIRSALENLGGNPIKKIIHDKKSGGNVREAIQHICNAATELSQQYTGALIVIERNTHLGDIVQTGIVINADPDESLIKNIFFNKAPLHDGAMIIRNGRVHAAGCFLPLSTSDEIIKDLGTRHRAAIGLSECSDAAVIVVSEETGTISLAVDGKLHRNYDSKTLCRELYKLLDIEEEKKVKGAKK